MRAERGADRMPVGAHTVESGAANVPVMLCPDPRRLSMHTGMGALRYNVAIDERASAETLLVNNGSETLVVVLHGMMVPEHHHLPRFEWLRTMQATDYSVLYLSDPTLQADPALRLGWYLGWEDLDLYPVLAQLIRSAATAVGARHIVLAGSSGGGYASLQLGAHLPGSMAIAFNAQTDIAKYHWKIQASYVRRVMPHLLLSGKQRKSWTRALGMRASVLTRYRYARQNYVLCVQNIHDLHHMTEHFEPFKALIERSPNKDRAVFQTYEGPAFHDPPSRGRFRRSIDQAVSLLESHQAAAAESAG